MYYSISGMYPFYLLALFLFATSSVAQSYNSLQSEVFSILKDRHHYRGSRIYSVDNALVSKDTLERFKDVLHEPEFPSFKDVHYFYFTGEKNAQAALSSVGEVSLAIPADTPTKLFIPHIASRFAFIDLILEVKQILKENYSFNGTFTAASDVDNEQFEQGLRSLKYALEKAEFVPSFERVREILFTNTDKKEIQLLFTNVYLRNVVKAEVPFDIPVDLLIPSLSFRLLRWKIGKLLKDYYGYRSSYIQISNGIGALELIKAFQGFKRALETAELVPDFGIIRMITITDGDTVSILPDSYSRYNNYNLDIPVTTPMESLIPILTEKFSIPQLQQEIQKNLEKKYKYPQSSLELKKSGIDDETFVSALEKFRKVLQINELPLSFENIYSITMTDRESMDISSTPYTDNLYDLSIPVTTPMESLIPLLTEKFTLPRLRREIKKILEDKYLYHPSLSTPKKSGIDDETFVLALKKFKEVLQTGDLPMSFENIHIITIIDGESVGLFLAPYTNNSYNLDIPATILLKESLIPILTTKSSIIQRQWEIQKILEDKYQYQQELRRPKKSGIDDELFLSALETFKEVLQTNDLSVNFENIHYIFITDAEHSWTSSYHDGRTALYIPANTLARTLALLMELALTPLDELESKVFAQLQLYNYRGPSIQNHSRFNVSDSDYRKGLENLWFTLKNDRFIPDLGSVDRLWITKRKQKTWTLPKDNRLTLMISSETAREFLMDSISIAINGGYDGLLDKVERTLRETFHFSGLVIRSWSVDNDEMFARGLRFLLAALESKDTFTNLNAVNRFIITDNDASLWTFLQDNGLVDVYIPSNVDVNDLIRFLSR